MTADEFGENRCGRNGYESSFHRYVSFLEPDSGKTASFIFICSPAAPLKGRWNGAVQIPQPCSEFETRNDVLGIDVRAFLSSYSFYFFFNIGGTSTTAILFIYFLESDWNSSIIFTLLHARIRMCLRFHLYSVGVCTLIFL